MEADFDNNAVKRFIFLLMNAIQTYVRIHNPKHTHTHYEKYIIPPFLAVERNATHLFNALKIFNAA